MFRSLKIKLSFPVFGAILVLTVAVSTLFLHNFKQFFIERQIDEESRAIQLDARLFPDSLLAAKRMPDIQSYCLFLDGYLKQRVTFIDTSGRVLGDSRLDTLQLKKLENHRSRPEILALRTGGLAFAYEIRYSETMHMRMLYMASPVVRAGSAAGYLRYAVPLREIDNYLIAQILNVLALTALAFLIIGFIVYYFSRRIQAVIQEIGENAKLVENGRAGERNHFGFSLETDRLYDFLDDTSERLKVLIGDLVSQREEVRVLLRSVSEAVIAVDGRMNVLFANDNACRLFGSQHTSDTLPRIPVTGFTHLPTFEEVASESLRTRTRVERMVVFKGQSRDYDLRVACTPIFRENQKNESLALLTIVDLTEEKRLARAKAEFVEAASHELRTPLTVLKGYMETLDDNPDAAMRDQCYVKIRNSVVRLENLTGDLLQLSSLENGKVTFTYETFSLEQTVFEILNDLGPLLKAKDIGASVDCPEPLKSVPELIYITMYNLITNAVKYNRQSGRIEIRSIRSNGQYEIHVLDSGLGIPQEFRERVFERFFRLDKHRSRETGGTGLGLAIVKHIVSTLKGSVRVQDGIDGGAGFVVYLPIASA